MQKDFVYIIVIFLGKSLMQQSNNAQAIKENISLVRQLLSRCAEQFNPFESRIVSVLQLACISDYSSIIDCFYLFEDTELAKDHARRSGLGTLKDQEDFGLVYLKFYGLMNACYLQQQAILVCTDKLQLKTDLTQIKSNQIIQYRNDFAAHSPNRGRGQSEHSFILDRFGLLEGRVAGYTANSCSGLVFRGASLVNLLSEWDTAFQSALESVCTRIATLIQMAYNEET